MTTVATTITVCTTIKEQLHNWHLLLPSCLTKRLISAMKLLQNQIWEHLRHRALAVGSALQSVTVTHRHAELTSNLPKHWPTQSGARMFFCQTSDSQSELFPSIHRLPVLVEKWHQKSQPDITKPRPVTSFLKHVTPCDSLVHPKWCHMFLTCKVVISGIINLVSPIIRFPFTDMVSQSPLTENPIRGLWHPWRHASTDIKESFSSCYLILH